ncbi:MAG: hypothetical protein U1C58_01030 [Flavobacteriaceae bacterium]|nr:hypothetical protein [Flavobacteriaceae bacterium]
MLFVYLLVERSRSQRAGFVVASASLSHLNIVLLQYQTVGLRLRSANGCKNLQFSIFNR